MSSPSGPPGAGDKPAGATKATTAGGVAAPSSVSASSAKDSREAERLASVAGTLEELSLLMSQIHEADNFAYAMNKAEEAILKIMDAERMTIYQKGKNDREIVSKFMSGHYNRPNEVRVPLNASSIAGYVALSQRPVLISDVGKPELLKKIHPLLRFNHSFDKRTGYRTESVIAIPIRYREVLLGVFQVLNKVGGGSFTRQDFYKSEMVARHIAQRFRHELRGTQTPFEYLLQKGVISQEQLGELEEAAKRDSISVRDMLLRSGKVTKKELGFSLEQYYQVPFMEYDAKILIPKDLLAGVSASYLKQQTWVPVSNIAGEVSVLIDDPSNAPLIMEIQRTIAAEQYVFKIGFLDDIQKYISQVEGMEGMTNSTSSLVSQLHQEGGAEVIDDVIDSAGEARESEATVIKLVNQIILEAQEARASDIHIEPGKGKAPAIVRIRVDGACRVLTEVPPTHKNALISRIKIISKLDISERRKPQDGKVGMKVNGKSLELRVATIPTVNGEAAVLRLLASGEPLPLDKLAFSASNYKRIKELIETPHGLFLVAGPTGSGKTTTLHAVLGHLNTVDKKIWTAEDPVEISQVGLCQVAVLPKIGFTFAAALRSFLRADPDVVMIGEMRDHETAHVGVEASLTGHLVLSTLHTNSAPETITRLLDLGLDPASFSDALLGVVSQRLVRTLCGKCKEPYLLTEKEHETLVRFYGDEHAHELRLAPGKTQLYRPMGCQLCGGSGYRGRMGVHELLGTSSEMRRLIYRKSDVQEIRHLAMSQGMRTLLQDGLLKLVEGHTDLSQLRKIATS